jgi:fatty-acyl-CoA synthase
MTWGKRECSGRDQASGWQCLAAYKCPRYVVFQDVPKTSTGKIQKFKLRDVAKGVG